MDQAKGHLGCVLACLKSQSYTTHQDSLLHIAMQESEDKSPWKN